MGIKIQRIQPHHVLVQNDEKAIKILLTDTAIERVSSRVQEDYTY